MYILAGDIGGTKARLGIFESGPKGLKPGRAAKFASRQYPSLQAVVEEFMSAGREPIDAACFGIACTYQFGEYTMPNLNWKIDAGALSQTLRVPNLWIVNDVAASAYAITFLQPQDTVTIKDGESDPRGNYGVISAGTGLGEAALIWDGVRYRPFASEGGHCDFAPRDELEIALLQHFIKVHGRVSYERILSGPGLYGIYRFLLDTGRGAENRQIVEEMHAVDPAAVISGWALAGKDPVCEQALEMFVSVYGAEAGNFALKFITTGGIYLGGGIAPKILPRLRDRAFSQSFVHKGRLRSILERLPVRVIVHSESAVLGAAQFAYAHSGQPAHAV